MTEPITPRSRNIHEVMKQTAQRRKEAQKLDEDVLSKVALFEGGGVTKKPAPRAKPKPDNLIKAFEYVRTELTDDTQMDHHEATGKLMNNQFNNWDRTLSKEIDELKTKVSNPDQATQLVKLSNDVKQLTKEKQELEAKVDDLQQRYERLKEGQADDIADLKAELEHFSKIQTELEAELEQTKSQHASVEAQLAATQAQIATISQAAPRGDVALVFTDVQGSTTQWEMHADVMSTALSLHNDLMRKKITEYGGYEVKTEGDAFMIAFESPIDATRWCLDVQEALMNEDWPPALYNHPDSAIEKSTENPKHLLYRGLRVRMGVHFGHPRAERDPVTTRMDYFGPMVNRSARVEGATHGGQVIISQAVVDAMGNDWVVLVGDPAQKCLGAFQLKGLDTPETLYELLPQSLSERTFKPPPVKPVPVEAPSGKDVTLLAIDVQCSDELFELYPLAMMPAVRLYKDLVDQQRVVHRGYVVRKQMDAHVLAFASSISAIKFACSLQEAMLAVEWPDELKEHEAAATVAGEDDGAPLFCGLRPRIAIVRGDLEEQVDASDPAARSTYVGPAIAALSQLHSSAKGGQCLATIVACPKAAKKELKTVTSRDIGKLDDKTAVVELLPVSLQARAKVFGKTKLMTRKKQAKPPSGTVGIAHAIIAGAAALWEHEPEAMRKAVHVWNRLATETATNTRGYISSSKGGRFSVAFPTAAAALAWAMKLQLALVQAQWPDALHAQENTLRVPDQDKAEHYTFRGLRAAVAIEYGDVQTSEDALSDSVTYIGEVALNAEAAAKMAAGGQTLLGVEAVANILPHVQYDGFMFAAVAADDGKKVTNKKISAQLAGVVLRDVGRVMLRDQLANTRVYAQALPEKLANRTFENREIVPPTDNVTLVLASVPDYTDVLEASPLMAADALMTLETKIKTLAHRFDGYVARSNGDYFMLAFGDSHAALRWAMTIQSELVFDCQWPDDMHKLEWCSQVKNPDDESKLLYQGFRVAMALHSGEPRYETHPMTGRLDFFGDVTTAAAAMINLVSPGQVVVSETVWDAVAPSLPDLNVESRALTHKLHFVGIEQRSKLRQVLPRSLAARTFPKLGSDSTRRRITGDTLRKRVGALGTQNTALNNKLDQLEDELEEASSKVKSLSKQLREVERGGQDDPASLLKVAFSEVERVVETQDTLTTVVSEVNKDNKALLHQLSDFERQLDLVENQSVEERAQLQQTIDRMRKQLLNSNTDNAVVKRLQKEVKQARSEAKEANAQTESLRTAAVGLAEAASARSPTPATDLAALNGRLVAAKGVFEKSGRRRSQALVKELQADIGKLRKAVEEAAAVTQRANKRATKLDTKKKLAPVPAALRQIERTQLDFDIADGDTKQAQATAYEALLSTVVGAVGKMESLQKEIERLSQMAKAPSVRRDSDDWIEALTNLETEGSFTVTAAGLRNKRRHRHNSDMNFVGTSNTRRDDNDAADAAVTVDGDGTNGEADTPSIIKRRQSTQSSLQISPRRRTRSKKRSK